MYFRPCAQKLLAPVKLVYDGHTSPLKPAQCQTSCATDPCHIHPDV